METQSNQNELFVKAEELRKTGRHQQAAEIFRACWNLEKSEDIAWRLISCLRHLSAREEAWQVLYEAKEIVPVSHQLKIQHQWMLYDFDLADAKSRKSNEKIIEISEQLLDMAPDGMLLQLVVFAATDACKVLNLPEKTLQYLSYLSKSSLDKAPREFDGSKIISWRERWYFACINALFDLGNFVECRDTALEAYKDFPAKIEYARKAALCLAADGHEQPAADELEVLVRGRRAPWYIYTDLARLLFECGNIDKAWLYSCKAAEASGEVKTKVNLFYLMARVLLTKGNRDAAAVHASLAVAARSEQGWSVPEELSEFMQKFNLNSENANSASLMQACRKYWVTHQSITGNNEIATNKNERHLGCLLIKSPETPFAFIRSKSFSENIYVKTSDIPEKLRCDGAKIEFSVQTSFDTKKNRESIKAIQITAV